MTTQVAVRFDREFLERLDRLVHECSYDTRADVIRAAITRLMSVEENRRIDRAIVDGYTGIAPTATSALVRARRPVVAR